MYFPNNLKDKDKEEDAFIGTKEIVLYMMMTQTQDKLHVFHHANNSTESVAFYILILDKIKIIQVETVDLTNKLHSLIHHGRKEQDLKIQTS